MPRFLHFALLYSGLALSIASCSTLNLPKAHMGGGAPVPRSSGNSTVKSGSRDGKETKTATARSSAPVTKGNTGKHSSTSAAKTAGTTKKTPPNTTAKSAPAKTTSKLASLEARRLDIVDYAEQFKGITYKTAGKTPYTGFDCSGFTSYVMKGFGVNLSPSSSEQSQDGVEVDLEEVKPGDLLFFGTNDEIQHVAIVVRNDEEGIFCVHSTTSRGVIVENVSASGYWKPRIMFARDVVSPR